MTLLRHASPYATLEVVSRRRRQGESYLLEAPVWSSCYPTDRLRRQAE